MATRIFVPLMERFKKIAAGGIIVIITVMMLIMFLPGEFEQYTGLMNTGNMGSYAGQAITIKDYRLAFNTCRNRFASQSSALGQIPERFIYDCAAYTLKQEYVLQTIGTELGLTVSKEAVEKSLLESIKRAFAQSNRKGTDPDDRISMHELYLQEAGAFPVPARMRRYAAIQTDGALRTGFPYPAEAARTEEIASRTVMDLRYVRYSPLDLSRSLEPKIRVSKKEVRDAYNKEMEKKSAADKKPFKERRAIIKSRLRSELKTKELKRIKTELIRLAKKPGSFNLQAVSALTGMKIQSRNGLKLSGLPRIRTESGPPMDLAKPKLLMKLSKMHSKSSKNAKNASGNGSKRVFVGPIEDGINTVFVEASRIRIGRANRAKPEAMDKEVRFRGRQLVQKFMVFLFEQEATRGSFKVKKIKPRRR